MYQIKNSDLPALFTRIAVSMDLYMPLEQGKQINYGCWHDTAVPALDTLKTVKSPKDLFFPQSETLYTCKREEHKISIHPEALEKQPFVVFGIRGCDAKGLQILDRVFLAPPIDTYYAARREQGILVSMACHEPEESCFCTIFEVDASEPEADVVTWLIDDSLYWKPLTDKGHTLTALCEDLFTSEDEVVVEREKQEITKRVTQLPYAELSLNGFDKEHMQELFDSPKWNQLYHACLGCGTCTFVCPTCQCYDIKDYDTGHGVKRFRCWDSCMYSDFTMMAHGNNRTSQLERFRQRFMHKLVYYPANYDGMYSCTGCGRCVRRCPSSLNIVKVIKSLGVSEYV